MALTHKRTGERKGGLNALVLYKRVPHVADWGKYIPPTTKWKRQGQSDVNFLLTSLPISETDIWAHFSANNELLHGFLQKERVALTYHIKVCAAEILTHVSERILEVQHCIVAACCKGRVIWMRMKRVGPSKERKRIEEKTFCKIN